MQYNQSRENYIKNYISKICGILDISMPKTIFCNNAPSNITKAEYDPTEDVLSYNICEKTKAEFFYILTCTLRRKWQIVNDDTNNGAMLRFNSEREIDARAFATAAGTIFCFELPKHSDQDARITDEIYIKSDILKRQYFQNVLPLYKKSI